ncbi:MAG: EamA family transporter, partial [Chloroflexi bacterium]
MSSAALRLRILSADMALALRVRAGAGLGRIWLPLLIVYLVWGSTYLGIRLAIDTIPPLLMAGVRFSVAGAILYAFSIGRGETQRDRPGRVQWVAALLVGELLLFGGNGGVVLAERSIPTGIAALLVATVPL